MKNILQRLHTESFGDTMGRAHYNLEYLTTKALGSGNITFTIPSNVGTSYLTNVSYRKNGGEWTTTTNSSSEVVITVSVVANDIIEWKGNGKRLCGGGAYTSASKFGGTVQFNVYGNAMSMLWGDDFIGQTQFPDTARERVMQGLFYQSSVVDASNLVLPATHLSNTHAYMGMFSGCTSLVYPPAELPEPESSVTLELTYMAMFSDCTSMVRCPDMNWGVLGTCKNGTFYKMFYGCTALTDNIPDKIEVQNYTASTSGYQIFRQMFRGCTHITTIPSLIIHNNNSTITGADNGPFYHVFYGCTSLIDLSNKTLTIENSTNTSGYEFSYTFAASTNIEKSPLIRVPETHKCTFYRMFDGGTRKITDLYLDIDNVYTDGTASNGAFYYMLVNTGGTGAGTSAWNNQQGQMLHLYGDITTSSAFSTSYGIFGGASTAGWSPYWTVVEESTARTLYLEDFPESIDDYDMSDDHDSREYESFVIDSIKYPDRHSTDTYFYNGDTITINDRIYHIWVPADVSWNDGLFYSDMGFALLTDTADYKRLVPQCLEQLNMLGQLDFREYGNLLGANFSSLYAILSNDSIYMTGTDAHNLNYQLLTVEDRYAQ